MMRVCTVCLLEFKKVVDDDVYYCFDCDHYQYFRNDTSNKFDHPKLSQALVSLREKQSKLIVNELSKLLSSNLNSLTAVEVGAGKGYLIKEVKKKITKCYALDVDETYKNELESLGIEFKLGNLDNKNNFEDVDIVFGSHVFEHLVEPSQFLSDLDLPNIKFVVLFIPNSKGLIFLFGRFLNKIRVSLLWDRLFQKHSNSPHYHYFSEKSFTKFVEKNNFKLVSSLNLNMVNYIPNFKRVNATESLVISIISSIFLSFLEILNRVFNICDSKAYFLQRV